MPIYEFRCQECQRIAEYQLKLSDPYPTECPNCHKGQLQKIMSLPAFQLKGGGWYADSYDGKSNKKAGPSADTSASSPGSSTPSDSKSNAAPSSSSSGSSGSSSSGSSGGGSGTP
jgi:putative FmdB family regulatory protein